MPGFVSSISNNNEAVFANNGDFSGSVDPAETNGLQTNGQLWIGSTALNAGSTHINVGTITSPDNSVTIGYTSPNITLNAGAAAGTLKTLTPTENFDGSAATPISGTAGNINAFGVNPSYGTVTETLNSNATAAGNLQVEHRAWLTGLVVDPSTTPGTRGTFATISSALTAAVSGQTIFIRNGTYTENLTLKAGVNITAFTTEGDTPNVIISGNATLSTAGTVTISNIQLRTNAASFLTVSGAVAAIVNLNNCNLNALNSTGITFSASSTSAAINIYNSKGNIATTGIAIYSMSSTGTMTFNNCVMTNSGGSTTASSNSAGSVIMRFTLFMSRLATSATGTLNTNNCIIDSSAQNVTPVTTAGTGITALFYTVLVAGTASSASAGAGTNLGLTLCVLSSSNTNNLTGAGIINEAMNRYSPSFGNNATTQVYGYIKGSGTNTAPTAGAIGEQITSNATAVAFVTATDKTVTSIALTPGVWDVSGFCWVSYSGVNTQTILGISTTNNTLPAAVAGIGRAQLLGSGTALNGYTLNIPAQRALVSTTTTYYLVVNGTFSTGAGTANGYITATRVA